MEQESSKGSARKGRKTKAEKARAKKKQQNTPNDAVESSPTPDGTTSEPKAPGPSDAPAAHSPRKKTLIQEEVNEEAGPSLTRSTRKKAPIHERACEEMEPSESPTAQSLRIKVPIADDVNEEAGPSVSRTKRKKAPRQEPANEEMEPLESTTAQTSRKKAPMENEVTEEAEKTPNPLAKLIGSKDTSEADVPMLKASYEVLTKLDAYDDEVSDVSSPSSPENFPADINLDDPALKKLTPQERRQLEEIVAEELQSGRRLHEKQKRFFKMIKKPFKKSTEEEKEKSPSPQLSEHEKGIKLREQIKSHLLNSIKPIDVAVSSAPLPQALMAQFGLEKGLAMEITSAVRSRVKQEPECENMQEQNEWDGTVHERREYDHEMYLCRMTARRVNEEMAPEFQHLRSWSDFILRNVADLDTRDAKDVFGDIPVPTFEPVRTGFEEKLLELPQSTKLANCMYNANIKNYDAKLLNLLLSHNFDEQAYSYHSATKVLRASVLHEIGHEAAFVQVLEKIDEMVTKPSHYCYLLLRRGADEAEEQPELIVKMKELCDLLSRIVCESVFAITTGYRLFLEPRELHNKLQFLKDGWIGWMERGGLHRVYAAYGLPHAKLATKKAAKIDARITNALDLVKAIDRNGPDPAQKFLRQTLTPAEDAPYKMALANVLSIEEGEAQGKERCDRYTGENASFGKCPLYFSKKENLKWHRAVCHDSRSDYKCELCLTNAPRFLTLIGLQLHKRIYHEENDDDDVTKYAFKDPEIDWAFLSKKHSQDWKSICPGK